MEPYAKATVEKGEIITCDGCSKELKEGDSFIAVKHTGTFCTLQCYHESGQ
jgi:hypothetical protein